MVSSLAALIPTPAADSKDAGFTSAASSRGSNTASAPKPEFDRLLEPPPAQPQRASSRMAQPLKDTKPERPEPLKSEAPLKDGVPERADPLKSDASPKDGVPERSGVKLSQPEKEASADPQLVGVKPGHTATAVETEAVKVAKELELLLAANAAASGTGESTEQAQTETTITHPLATDLALAKSGTESVLPPVLQQQAADAVPAPVVAAAPVSVLPATDTQTKSEGEITLPGQSAAPSAITSAEQAAQPVLLQSTKAEVATHIAATIADSATATVSTKEAGSSNPLGATPADPKAGEAAKPSTRAPDSASPGLKSVPDTGPRPVFAEWLQDFASAHANGSRIHDPLAGLERGAQTPGFAGAAEGGRPTPLQMLPIEIGMQAMRGVTKFQIRLDPAELGRVDVSLEIRESGEVEASLVVDRVETLALLKRDASTLQTAFEQAGLKQSPDGLSFSLRGDGQKGEGQQGREQHPRWQNQREDEALPVQNQIAGMAMRRMMIPNSSIDRVI